MMSDDLDDRAEVCKKLLRERLNNFVGQKVNDEVKEALCKMVLACIEESMILDDEDAEE